MCKVSKNKLHPPGHIADKRIFEKVQFWREFVNQYFLKLFLSNEEPPWKRGGGNQNYKKKSCFLLKI